MLPDGPCRLAVIIRGDNLEIVRQEPLLDEHNGVPVRVESNCSEVFLAAADANVHRTGG
jgi:hypothetical protein